MAAISQQQQAPPLPVRFDETGEEVDDDEVLTAAESYERLLTSTKEQLFGMIRQLNQYDTLVKKLKGIRDERTRDVLVPVAGGMGYFSGRITHTNELMVLLGNNWFAERSVSQGLGIAERRVEFLKREIKVLEEQVKSITSKQDMFMASALDQQQNNHYLDAAPVAKRSTPTVTQKPKVKAAPSTNAAATTLSSGPATTFAPASSAASKNGADATKISTIPYQAEEDDAEVEEEEDYYDENEPIIEPEDELTLNELIDIEDELGDDIANEELAEKAILAKIAEKRRKRLGLPECGSSTATPTIATPPTNGEKAAITTPTAPSSSAPFFSPGDIGRGFVATPSSTEEEPSTTKPTTPTPPPVADSPKKQVHFTDPVAAAPNSQPRQQQQPPTVVSSKHVTPAASVRSTNAAQSDTIVVHDSSSGDEDDFVKPTPAPSQDGRAKKSRFARENGL
jgi:prefoldin subunit 5